MGTLQTFPILFAKIRLLDNNIVLWGHLFRTQNSPTNSKLHITIPWTITKCQSLEYFHFWFAYGFLYLVEIIDHLKGSVFLCGSEKLMYSYSAIIILGYF